MGGLCFEDGETVVSISSEDDCGADLTAEIAVANEPVKDIWPADDIWTSVQSLRGADEILPLLEAGLVEAAAAHAHGPRSALLCAAWLGRSHLLEKLLATGLDVDVRDDCGRSALHLSCLLGGEDCARVLLAAGANPNAWDVDARATPLHCAASGRHLACLKLLIRHGADVNAGLATRSALHYAVLSDAPACVMELLQNGACPDTPQVQQETPLHAAAAAGAAECARLLLAAGADARAQLGPARSTALHLAVEDGHAECARLLLDSGACIDARNAKGQTPLHIACLAQSLETVELLIARGAVTDVRDADGRVSLHGAIVRGARSCDVARTLLAAGAHPNLADNFGYTPLHVAALHEFSGAVCLLIDYGGDVTLRTNGGVSALAFIVRRTPDVLPRYLAKFDAAVRSSEHELGDVDCELRLDFRPLVPCLARGETELALAFIDVGRRDVLKHPLCETFLFLKWKRIRKFFILGLVYHAIFVSLFSVYVISVFRAVNRHQYEMYIAYVIIVLNICFMAKELFQVRHSWLNYVKQWENWLQWIIIMGVFICTIPLDSGKYHAPAVMDSPMNRTHSEEDVLVIPDATWRHEVAAITIFCCWLELMMIVGRFPTFGLYVQMFTTVAINFATFLMAYSCLLMAFGLAFVVLFANYASFANILPGLIKTVMMMSGELEYEDIFYSDRSPIQFPLTAHILFLLFVVLVTVILTNLLVGLAVSDIQALQESAGLDRLVRQAQLVAHLESMLFSRLLAAPRIALAVLRRGALLTASPYRAGISIRPNDPRENRIPKDLIASVYKLVVSRKPERKSIRKKDYQLEIMKPKEPEANPKKEVVNRRSNLFETYSSDIQQSGVERRKRTSSNSTENRQRPTSCFSAIPDVCFTDIRSQMAEMNKKVDKWLEATEAKLNSLEEKIDKINTDGKNLPYVQDDKL